MRKMEMFSTFITLIFLIKISEGNKNTRMCINYAILIANQLSIFCIKKKDKRNNVIKKQNLNIKFQKF